VRAQGWDIDIAAHVRRGGRVLGVCGGFQMLGRSIADPHGIEGPPESAPGLGLLDIETVMSPAKTVRPVSGVLAEGGAVFAGYEIHAGVTRGPALARPLLRLADGRAEGAISADGRIAGAYVHGLFDQGAARKSLLAGLGAASAGCDHGRAVDAALDEIAAALADSLDIEALSRIAGL
jgi:adenosylcobyric acid synthase